MRTASETFRSPVRLDGSIVRRRRARIAASESRSCPGTGFSAVVSPNSGMLAGDSKAVPDGDAENSGASAGDAGSLGGTGLGLVVETCGFGIAVLVAGKDRTGVATALGLAAAAADW